MSAAAASADHLGEQGRSGSSKHTVWLVRRCEVGLERWLHCILNLSNLLVKELADLQQALFVTVVWLHCVLSQNPAKEGFGMIKSGSARRHAPKLLRRLCSATKDENQRGASIFMMNDEGGTKAGVWILDSGAAFHVAPTVDLFYQHGTEPQGTKIYAANGEEMQIFGTGNISHPLFELKDVLCVPCLNKTVVSVSKLDELDYEVSFNKAGCSVRDKRTWYRKLVGEGRRVNGQYVLEYLRIPRDRAPVPEGSSISLWKTAWSWLGLSSLTKSLFQRDSALTSQRPPL